MSIGFKIGWNNHSEKYKYSEEDLIKIIELSRDQFWDTDNRGFSQDVEGDWSFKYTEEEILQALQQPKEIQEIEFEVDSARFSKEEGWEVLPTGLKITKTSEFPNGLLTIKNVK
jgi:hypothetical protein